MNSVEQVAATAGVTADGALTGVSAVRVDVRDVVKPKLADLNSKTGLLRTDVDAAIAKNVEQETHIQSVNTKVTGLAAKVGSDFLGKIRRLSSGNALSLDDLIVAQFGLSDKSQIPTVVGTIYYVELEMIGGGASGCAFANSTPKTATCHGGHPGRKRRQRVIYEPGLKINLTVGAGGALVISDAPATVVSQNAGGDTFCTVERADGTAPIFRPLVGEGGRTFASMRLITPTAPASTTEAALHTLQFLTNDGTFPALLGVAVDVGTASTPTGFTSTHADAQAVTDSPAGGGGSVRGLHGNNTRGGKGGDALLTARPGSSSNGDMIGGSVNGGGNPPANDARRLEAGGYGSGGNGSRQISAAETYVDSGAGGVPGGGSGGSLNPVNTSGSGAVARAGGQGAADFFLFGKAPGA